MSVPYNPLDKVNLARSIEVEVLSRDPIPLANAASISGAGVYVVYYTGPNPAYAAISIKNINNAFSAPIYIGKAIPKGGRKGGLGADVSKSRALADRLGQHASSISEATTTLSLEDFFVRTLVLDDVWIPLGENMLIETFKPVWNIALDGFGNKDPGRRRATQYKSPWDVVHPGRSFAEKLADSPADAEFLIERINDFFSGNKLKPLPKALKKQIEESEEEDAEAADNV